MVDLTVTNQFEYEVELINLDPHNQAEWKF